jgi:hypothetical protein
MPGRPCLGAGVLSEPALETEMAMAPLATERSEISPLRPGDVAGHPLMTYSEAVAQIHADYCRLEEGELVGTVRQCFRNPWNLLPEMQCVRSPLRQTILWPCAGAKRLHSMQLVPRCTAPASDEDRRPNLQVCSLVAGTGTPWRQSHAM